MDRYEQWANRQARKGNIAQAHIEYVKSDKQLIMYKPMYFISKAKFSNN